MCELCCATAHAGSAAFCLNNSRPCQSATAGGCTPPPRIRQCAPAHNTPPPAARDSCGRLQHRFQSHTACCNHLEAASRGAMKKLKEALFGKDKKPGKHGHLESGYGIRENESFLPSSSSSEPYTSSSSAQFIPTQPLPALVQQSAPQTPARIDRKVYEGIAPRLGQVSNQYLSALDNLEAGCKKMVELASQARQDHEFKCRGLVELPAKTADGMIVRGPMAEREGLGEGWEDVKNSRYYHPSSGPGAQGYAHPRSRVAQIQQNHHRRTGSLDDSAHHTRQREGTDDVLSHLKNWSNHTAVFVSEVIEHHRQLQILLAQPEVKQAQQNRHSNASVTELRQELLSRTGRVQSFDLRWQTPDNVRRDSFDRRGQFVHDASRYDQYGSPTRTASPKRDVQEATYQEALRSRNEENEILRLKEEVRAGQQQVQKLTRLLEQDNARKSRSGAYTDGEATPVLLDDHVRTVKEKLLLFAKEYGTVMEKAGLPLKELCGDSGALSRTRFARSTHHKYLAAYVISTAMFQGFEIDGFCGPGPLDLDKPHEAFFEEFQQLKSSKTVVDLNPANSSISKMVQFARSKFFSITPAQLVPTCQQTHHPYYRRFVALATALWLLQRLALSFLPSARIFRVDSGADFNPSYMANIVDEDEHPFLPKVAFMVVPGFRVGKVVIKSEVYSQISAS